MASAVAGLVLVTGLAACGSGDSDDAAATVAVDPDEGGGAEWDAIVEAANEEGEVVLYESPPGLDERLTEGFAAAYPDIELTILRQATGDLTTRLDQEKTTDAAGADVAFHSSLSWFEDNVDALAEPAGPARDEYWADADGLLLGDGAFANISAGTYGYAINTELFEELGADPIEEYADLLQPELDGAIGIAPAGNSPASTQWWYFAYEELGGEEGLTQLADLGPVPYDGGTAPLAEALAAGEHAVGAYEGAGSLAALLASGAPLELIDLDPAIAIGYYAGAVEWASHPNAAQVLINWLLSPAGQVALNGPGDLYTPLPLDVFGDVEVPDTLKSLPETAIITDGVLTPEQQTWLDEVWRPIMGG